MAIWSNIWLFLSLGTKFPLGTEVKVSRVSIEDYDECETEEYNDCSPFATCTNTKVQYIVIIMYKYKDILHTCYHLQIQRCSTYLLLFTNTKIY